MEHRTLNIERKFGVLEAGYQGRYEPSVYVYDLPPFKYAPNRKQSKSKAKVLIRSSEQRNHVGCSLNHL